ncbi:C-type lectin domain family 4 member E [Nothobranchius furzeri]|uniref:C-type lectin domain family 4 member E-like n=1 Tax=Nothobranchius furzeri TaxID=105023 RepID=A0A9D3BLV3_NOTFU|nr:C-type lectin domain family 4 member E [Nothobranchius furzeri]KAF7211373.1 C-type lectin domain family 4 member E-like [Nothobranchius furzeri]
MFDAEVIYSDVKFTKSKDREAVSLSTDDASSEVKILKKPEAASPAADATTSSINHSDERPPVCARCSADSQLFKSRKRSKVTPTLLVLLVLTVLGAAAYAAYFTFQTLQTLKEENEALRRNISETNSSSTTSSSCPVSSTSPPPATCSPAQNHTCGEGWEIHEGQCYHFNTSSQTWPESRRSCEALGADLVKIDSREEQEFLVGKLVNRTTVIWDSFWIGLSYSVVGGSFVWVDNSPLNTSLWAGAQPVNQTNGTHPSGSCVMMEKKNNTEDLNWWFDTDCNSVHKSICEKPAGTGPSSSVCG